MHRGKCSAWDACLAPVLDCQNATRNCTHHLASGAALSLADALVEHVIGLGRLALALCVAGVGVSGGHALGASGDEAHWVPDSLGAGTPLLAAS